MCYDQRHKGLFKYSCLAFGVASSPVILQSTTDTLLQGILQVVVYLDDIVVTGATEAQFLANQKQVLKRLSERGLQLKHGKHVFLEHVLPGHKITAKGHCPVEYKGSIPVFIPNVSSTHISYWCDYPVSMLRYQRSRMKCRRTLGFLCPMSSRNVALKYIKMRAVL